MIRGFCSVKKLENSQVQRLLLPVYIKAVGTHLKKELKFLEEGRVHIDVRLSLFCLLYQLFFGLEVLINHRPVV